MTWQMRLGVALIFLTIGCVCARAQTRFNDQIQPGLTTKTEVDQALGPPLQQVNATGGSVFEYKPLPGAAKLQVAFHTGTIVVDRIIAQFTKPYSRPAMLAALKLPGQSQGTRQSQGHLEEYFGSPAFLVFIYSSTDAESGVISLCYYSADVFRAEAPSAAAAGGNTPPPGGVRDAAPVNLAGDWNDVPKPGAPAQHASISQTGNQLEFTDEHDPKSRGYFLSVNTVVAQDWRGLRATISSDGNTLTWANGSIWHRVRR